MVIILKKKNYILLIFIAIVILIYFLSQMTFSKDTNDAIKVIKQYFRYMDSGNKEAALNLQSKMRRNPESLEWQTRDCIKLIWLREGSEALKISYMNYGLGKVEKPYDARVFHIVYYEHNKKGTVMPEGNGIKFKYISVTKKSKDSPWLISDIGEG